MVVLLIL
jgi:hypothetical protein